MKENKEIDILIGKVISNNALQDNIIQINEWKSISSKNNDIVIKSQKIWKNASYYISPEDLNSDRLNLETKYNNFLTGKVKNLNRNIFIYKIVASLFLLITLALAYYLISYDLTFTKTDEQLCEIKSPTGNISKCILPDNSEVWINSGSSIIYNSSSYNKKERTVNLIGEAYFQVSNNIEKPFLIKTHHANIKVTGTSFNVISYPENSIFESVTAKGSIELVFKTINKDTVKLIAGQRAIYNSDTKDLVIQQVDPNFFTSWRNMEIIFKDASLNDLIKELERIYNIKFHLTPKNIGNYRFRGMFSYNNNLLEALEKIKKTSGIDYYIENNEVWLKFEKK